MRHKRKGFKLGRTQAHRKATLSALANALIKHKRIKTTLTKARALRMYVEPIINRAKVDSTHSRRQVFRYLQDKYAVSELFGEIAEQIGDRPGGYTRIVKLGQRAGDSAQMAIIELVDYNDEKPEGSSKGSGRRRTRRGRRRSGGGGKPAEATATAAADEAIEDVVEEAAEEVADTVEDTLEDVAENTEDAVEVVEDAVEDVPESVEEAVEDVTSAVEDVAEDAATVVEDVVDEPAEAAEDEPAPEDTDASDGADEKKAE